MAGDILITVTGNLTNDPELRFTPNGVAVAKFTIASTPRSFNKDTNEWVDGDPVFFNCSAWKTLGENVAESLAKGSRVLAQGRLSIRSYEDKNGEKRTSVDLTVDEIGASLRYAITRTQKMARTSGKSGTPVADEFSSPAPAAATGFEDEPPF